ncbi:MAG: glycosyltransferase family 39 protein [Cytophagaceae bacterium]
MIQTWINKHEYKILFLFFIVIFFLKWDDLFLPYFWDEIGVYTQASLYLTDHGLSILPNSMPPELSRGHPLLFMFIFGLIYKVFGTSVFIGHLFALLISFLFTWSGYILLKRFSSSTLALAGILLLWVQPIFYIQSSFILPEILLGLFCIQALNSYLNQKYLATFIYTTLAIFTKETGLILPVAFALTSVYTKKWNKDLILEFLYYAAPFILFAIFIVIQKIQNGWYFFPYHTGFLSFKPVSIMHRDSDLIDYLLFQQGRFVVSFLLFISVTILLYRLKQVKEFHIQLESFYSFIPSILLFIGVIIYSGMNFHMNRYLFLIYPIGILFILLIVYNAIKHEMATFYVIILCSIIQLAMPKPTTHITEYDFNCRDLIHAQQNVCTYIENNVPEGKVIEAAFPVLHAFYDARLGYFTTIKHTLCESDCNGKVDYTVFSRPGNLEWSSLPTDKEIIYTSKIGMAEVYLVKMK